MKSPLENKEVKIFKLINTYIDNLESVLYKNITVIITTFYLVLLLLLLLSYFTGFQLPKNIHHIILGIMYLYLLIVIQSIKQQDIKKISIYGVIVCVLLLIVTKQVFINLIISVISVSISTLLSKFILNLMHIIQSKISSLDYSDNRDWKFGYSLERIQFVVLIIYFAGSYFISWLIVMMLIEPFN